MQQKEKPRTITELAWLLTRPRTTVVKELFSTQIQKRTSLIKAAWNISEKTQFFPFKYQS